MECEFCNGPIIPPRPNKRFCCDNCRYQHYDQNRKTPLPRPFVGLDGEGIGNRYILLASANGASIADKKGLTTEQCLDFLLQLPRGNKRTIRPIYVWFAFDYDVNMILGDIPLKGGGEGNIEDLRRDNELKWRGYYIRYFPRKFLQIARGKKVHTSYDTWSFYGTTFENALEQFGIQSTSTISEGKAARGDFSKWSLKKIAEYNNAELETLSSLSEKLRDCIRPLQIPIQSWHGPGSIANGWLRKNHIVNHIQIQPSEIQPAINSAYFGGRIDARGYGFSSVYHYDLVSAYPSGARYLPSLSDIHFEKTNQPIPGIPLFLAKIRWKVTDEKAQWAPFPWRSKNGTIRYPLAGSGWYWNPEIQAAIESYPWQLEIEYIETWNGIGKINYPLKNLIEEAFEYRRELKKRGDLSNIAIKLMLNSIYGKFAQTVGKPRYQCLTWAGLITSLTRAELLRVIDGNTLCVMTDSIWSSQPLEISLGNGLGEWESQEETELVLAEAGLYEATKPNGDKTVWQRGFNKTQPVDIRGIVQGWIDGDITSQPYTVTRFVGMGLASMTNSPWRNWVEFERHIHPVPMTGTTKRYPHFPHDEGCNCGENRFIDLQLRIADEDCCSYPYQKAVIDPALMKFTLEDECEE